MIGERENEREKRENEIGGERRESWRERVR
jgi:hypothetical protein